MSISFLIQTNQIVENVATMVLKMSVRLKSEMIRHTRVFAKL